MRKWLFVLGLALLIPSLAGAQNILQNPGFETGTLSPWTTNAWTITNTDRQAGTFAAEVMGTGQNWIMQTFTPVNATDIQSIGIWVKQTSGDPIQIELIYENNDRDMFQVNTGRAWTFVNLSPHLRGTGMLTGIRIWGATQGGADDLTLIDEVSIVRRSPTPTDESTWGRIKGLYF